MRERQNRLEITLSDEAWARLELARGFEPRASFVKRALESALGSKESGGPPSGGNASRAASASSRAPVEKEPPVGMGDVPEAPIEFKEVPLPKIAPRRNR